MLSQPTQLLESADRVREHERQIRAAVRRVVGADAIKGFRAIDLSYTFRDTLFIYGMLGAVIAAGIALHLTVGPWAIVAAPVLALLSGLAFNWINVQIHEASHHLLLPHKKWNDIYCNVVLGSWGLQDVETYRATHGMHHAHLHTELDPDIGIYTTDLGSKRAISRGVANDLLLLTALQRLQQVKQFSTKNNIATAGAPVYASVAKAAAQAIVLGAFLFFCGLWGFIYYGAFYLYGLLGVFPLLVRIRTVVQHHDDMADPKNIRMFTSRTTVASLAEFILVGARMDYHFEHHLFAMIPYYNLAKMHRALQAAVFFEDKTVAGLRTENYFGSYLRLAAPKRSLS
jgi:fatty acid desaturase